MRELLLEIYASIERNKLRTFLTGFSVAWGIFMLVILLGSGNGLKNGVLSNFKGMDVNRMTVYSSRTSMPYAGYKSNRFIALKKDDAPYIEKNVTNIKTASPSMSNWGKRAVLAGKYVSTRLLGVSPFGITTGDMSLVRGRFISENDIKQNAKIAVVDQQIIDALSPKEDIIGRTISIDKVNYLVVGVSKSRYMGSSAQVSIPISTYMNIYRENDYINNVDIVLEDVNTTEQSQDIERQVRKSMATKHSFSPDDPSGVWINNSFDNYSEVMTVFTGINLFVWIIGIGTLLAGVVGVSNIMLVTVRERTAEFGIRKSMGASPASLVRLVIVESVMITIIFGYIGMICGVAVMELVNQVLTSGAAGGGQSDTTTVVFLNPTLELPIIFSATVVLVIAGVIAGYVPARRAARLKTIDAMRYNK